MKRAKIEEVKKGTVLVRLGPEDQREYFLILKVSWLFDLPGPPSQKIHSIDFFWFTKQRHCRHEVGSFSNNVFRLNGEKSESL